MGASRTGQTDGTIPPVVASGYPDRHGPWVWQGMKLRTKLFLGYLVFTAALIVLGAGSAWHLREMGGVARNILANNYDSIVAAQEMRESLARQEAARLGLLLGEGGPARQDLTEERRRFDAALQVRPTTSPNREKPRPSPPLRRIGTPTTGKWTAF